MAKGGSEAKHGELDTRSRILEAAIALLIKRGGADVTMAEIGKAANVSRQAVYLHFADRGDLFLALVHYADEKRGLDKEIERIRNAPSAVAAIRAMASLQARSNPDIWPLARATDAVRRNDEALERAWQDRLQDRLAGCKAIVKSLAKEGSLRPDITLAAATDLLWTITSLRTWEDLVLERKWKPSEYEKLITDLLLRMLTKQQPESAREQTAD
jgi:AcrR family transcriptional regulator